VVFQENDLSQPPATFPPTPLMERLTKVMVANGNGGAAPDMRMGLKLYRTFVDAGLAAPEMRYEAPMGAGPSWPGFTYLAETMRSLAPMLARRGVPDVGTFDLETLARDLRDEALAARAVQRLPTVVGAWSVV
jgi:hypothetical protein